jgi:hypothetical protein
MVFNKKLGANLEISKFAPGTKSWTRPTVNQRTIIMNDV